MGKRKKRKDRQKINDNLKEIQGFSACGSNSLGLSDSYTCAVRTTDYQTSQHVDLSASSMPSAYCLNRRRLEHLVSRGGGRVVVATMFATLVPERKRVSCRSLPRLDGPDPESRANSMPMDTKSYHAAWVLGCLLDENKTGCVECREDLWICRRTTKFSGSWETNRAHRTFRWVMIASRGAPWAVKKYLLLRKGGRCRRRYW